MVQSNMTEGTTYIWLGLIAMLVIFMVSSMAEVISNSEHAELTNASKDKMESLSLNPDKLGFDAVNDTDKTIVAGFDTDVYDDRIEDALDPEVDDNKNEFSLDFTFGKTKANSLTKFIYAILNLPEYIVVGLFGLPKEGMLKHAIDLTDWVWRIMIVISIIYFVRNK